MNKINITSRERQILDYLLLEFTNVEISKLLNLTYSTVSNTLRNVYRKTGIRTRVGIATWWIKHKEKGAD